MFGSPEKLLPGLMRWKKPQHFIHSYGVGNFRSFLPFTDQTMFAEPYYVIDAEVYGRRPHMSYYYPPVPRGREVMIFTVLQQLHPNVFVNCRFGPRGTLAIVRADNKDYVDIVFR